MAKKKTEEKTVHRPADPNVMGLRGTVVEQPITRTLDENYMPYAMSVIVSRAIPEIDGFKPAHRKILYTMYKMGLLTRGKIKSANVVGQTMRLNPHGDAAIMKPWFAFPVVMGRCWYPMWRVRATSAEPIPGIWLTLLPGTLR